MSELPKKLRIKATMIELGERIAWGSEAALMHEAADKIEALEAELLAIMEQSTARVEHILRLEAELAALKAQEPVATVTIQHFKQDPSMENLEFQLQAPIPQGTHKLYVSPVAQQTVVMPERKKLPELMMATYHEYRGWNACLDEFERLNGGKQ